MDIKKNIQSGAMKKIIYGICTLVLLLVVFQFGEFVGFKKAEFSDKIGADYFRELSGQTGPMSGLRGSDFENAHGAIGKIVSIHLPTIVIEDRNGLDKTIALSTTTEIRDSHGTQTSQVLKMDNFVVVFGTADSDSVLDARLVRILPAPIQPASSSTIAN